MHDEHSSTAEPNTVSQSTENVSCEQVAAILAVCDAFTYVLERPLDILHVGSHREIDEKLAERDAIITNIDVATLAETQENRYDLVIALGIFDRISCYNKLHNVLQTAGKATIFDSNFGIQHEALQAFHFVHEITPPPTQGHLPLYFGSSSYWYINEKAEFFTHWTDQSQRFVGDLFENSRRYYFNEKHFVKLFTRTGTYAENNIYDIAREARFLYHNDGVLAESPKLLAVRASKQEAWLVRERLPGELLLDVMLSEQMYDPVRVLRDVLTQLVALEAKKLYHSDLRIWNVLLRDDGHAALIDYAAIIDVPEDCNWPQNIFLSFWIFVWCVTTRTAHPGIPLLPPRFSPQHLPAAYRAWAQNFWNTSPQEWSFADIFASFDAHAPEDAKPYVPSVLDLLTEAVESYADIVAPA